MTRKKEAGQALLAAAAVLGIVLMGFAGLGVDMGYLRYEKRLQQTAADAAAIAGAAELLYGGNYVTAAQNEAAANGFTNGGTGCPGSVGCVTVTARTPASGPHAGAAGYVEVLVAQVQPTFFMRILGVNNETITARAVATDTASASGCIYTLDHSGNSLNIQAGSISLIAPTCGIVDDSNFSLLNVGNATITMASIGVAGTYTPGCSNPGCNVSPQPVTGIVPAADPLSYLTPPTLGGCVPNPNGQGQAVNLVLQPGNYCNGITVSAGTDNITFNTGTYDIGGSGLSIQGNTATLTGSGVTFYEYGGALSIIPGTLNVNLAAPSTGPLAGILFWQAVSDTATANIDSTTSNATFQGTFYFPGAPLSMGNESNSAAYTFFVVKDLNIQGTTINLNNNTSSLPGGSPLKDALLVE